MTIVIDGSGTITGASTLATTVAGLTLTTPNIGSAPFATVSGTAPLYACRAWVNFNGTGTVAIRASGNVSSITDGGVGNYTVNFTTVMTDTNYAAVFMSEIGRTGIYAAGSFQFQTLNDAGSATDVTACNIAIFR